MFKLFLIFVAILPFMLFMAGCSGGTAQEREEYNPNEQNIYVHYTDDNRNTWEDAGNQLGKMGDDMHDTMKDAGRDVRRMDRDQGQIIGTLPRNR